ncbi:hypothetical protein J3R83DRAFT_2344 [Lanmaoa asiatica]|nr:hypothetical protein J3R83DRAFT_2344 [Lanmaoa asiatica]
MAMGAYSSASWPTIGANVPDVNVAFDDTLHFVPHYGVYVLIVNIAVSVIMLVVVMRLRMESRLGGDFINAIRLLLDPLKNPELFNASLDTTVNALADSYMLVREECGFLLAEEASSEKTEEVKN